ncbi:MAG TPA: hypothetical protein VK164_03850 [Flavobacterium sp.]|uniref:hypothetical protein n=1 Tax=Flavobacterium sp. TaxID=239 RepID=UPI002B4AC6D6|nr:hypothetical protein [Flavobacterium sp.]HLO73048.1 hypothetical protein [Flavobacterium sp.]
MNTLNLIITTIVGIIAIALFVLAYQFISKKINHEEEGKLKTAFAIWIGFSIASFALLLSSALKAVSGAIEVILGIAKTEIIEKVALFTGFTFMWFVVTYFITQFITAILLGKRTDSIEIDRNNYNYFIIKGIILLAFTFTFLSVFENFLRMFSPVVNTPFYH